MIKRVPQNISFSKILFCHDKKHSVNTFYIQYTKTGGDVWKLQLDLLGQTQTDPEHMYARLPLFRCKYLYDTSTYRYLLVVFYTKKKTR